MCLENIGYSNHRSINNSDRVILKDGLILERIFVCLFVWVKSLVQKVTLFGVIADKEGQITRLTHVPEV